MEVRAVSHGADMSISPRRIGGALFVAALAGCGGQPKVSSTPGSGPAPAQSISVNDGESLIRAMYARYQGRWYRNVTYTQTTTLLGQNGPTSDQLWYVAISAPGKQRIDYVNPDLGNGLIVSADSTYYFAGGKLVRGTVGWSDMLLLTQDVYMQPPEVTISILRSLGYQLSRLRTSSFDGRTTYVVGSNSVTDSSSKQF